MVANVTNEPATDIKKQKNLNFASKLDIIWCVENGEQKRAEAHSVHFFGTKADIRMKPVGPAGQSHMRAFHSRTLAFERVEKALHK